VLQLSAGNTARGVEVIQSTAGMVREMIERMNDSADKIRLLQESILVEEEQVGDIVRQTGANMELSRQIGIATDEQKKAIEASNRAIEDMNEMLGTMVNEIQEIAETTHGIYENAVELLQKTNESVGEA
jgi:methyl-accepting chemotaxis protein